MEIEVAELNIAIFAAFYQPHIGGFEKNAHELAKRLVLKGHNVSIVTCNTNNANAYELIDKVFVVRLPCWNILNGAYPIPLPKLSKQLQGSSLLVNPDVVITQTRFFPISLLGMLFALVKRKPLIHVERGSCHSVVQSGIVNLICRIYDHIIGSLIVKYAKVNVGISSSACDFINHLGAQARLIYNGIEISRFKQQLPYITNEISIIYVGRLIYAKGIQDLIEAFNQCGCHYPGIRLIIIGDGNYRQQLEYRAIQSRFANHIKFLGELDNAHVMSVLVMSDIFVNPSYSEGLPTSVIEAASVGLPVIATDVGGTNEIIEQSKTGLLVQPHDISMLTNNIMQVIMRLPDYKVMGNNAKELVKEKFNWDFITTEWIWLLNRLDKPVSAYVEYMD